MEHGAYYISITHELMKEILTTSKDTFEVIEGIPKDAIITQTLFDERRGIWGVYFVYGARIEGAEYKLFYPTLKRHHFEATQSEEEK